ncbi:nucleolar protein 10 [Bradysia coprophila]|uniref:nucleolar protein 10 n=1 Tax=Bradysia coprophila TaxID=38358 RepID=UPI00187DC217|nr:nucleolar protein 10 [Bradysia coprophila]
MFVTDVNDVKIYNLSAGKSLPEWLTDEKRRKALKQNVDLRKRIELIQDFDMPDECGTIQMSPDQQFIIATGTYKPRVKCFEVNNLSIKFERCFDSEVVRTEVLSDDYSKMVFLSCDRYIEFHASHGRHYRLRIPRCGYDMGYHIPTCDLFFVGASPEIYRLNLERGQFMQSFETQSKQSVNACDINPEHHLLCVGTHEGTVEAWDPRDKNRCATLDVAMKVPNLTTFPSISTIKFKNGLQMGVGTQSGHVLIYDIRSNQPLLVKDHYNKLKIKRIAFNPSNNAVYSMDEAIMKIWDESSGKQIAYIESESKFNDMCTIPNTGMMFFAQQTSKMLTYYIPSLGPAPRWCSFLDNLTEEIESETVQNIYDDYKFVTKQELEQLGLEHLEGTNLLRAYMHGFFIDIRLYNKARSVVEPFEFDKYRKEKVRQKIESSRPNRLTIKSNLPKVNQEIALKLMDEKGGKKKKGRPTTSLLDDNRFSAMFENPEFEIDKDADEYKMLTPVLSRLDKSKLKELKKQQTLKDLMDEDEEAKSSDDDLFSERDGSSDDEDERQWSKEVKKQYKQIKKKNAAAERNAEKDEDEASDDGEPKMVEVPTNEFKVKAMRNRNDRSTLGDRVSRDQDVKYTVTGSGNRQMSFSTKKIPKDVRHREMDMRKHREDRKRVIRPTTSLRLKKYVPR